MKVFITGELGLLASALEEELIRNGHDVVWGKNHRDIHYCYHHSYHDGRELDICDPLMLSRAIHETDPDVVIHTAAIVGTRRCEVYVPGAYYSNVYGTHNVVATCEMWQKRLLYFSTTAVYAPVSGVITEYDRKAPGTVYGMTKYLGECVVRNSKLDWTILYPCFVYGGKLDKHSAISDLIHSSIDESESEILLDPGKLKDYLYVADFARAVRMLLSNWKSCEEYNISYGNPVPFSEVISCVKQELPNIRYKLIPELDYLGDHCVDCSKLKKDLQWIPEVSLVEGIRKTIHDCQL